MKKIFIMLICILSLIISTSNKVYASDYFPIEYEIIDASGQSTYFYYISKDNTLYGAGSNASGLMGIGTITNDNFINPKKIIENVKKVSTGKGKHTIALTLSNDIYVWGNNKYAQLGIGTVYNNDSNTNNIAIPTQVIIEEEATPIDIKTGYVHTLILYDNGDVYSFGSNLAGQLGLGLDVSGKSVQGLPTKINSEYFNNEKVIEIASCEYTSYCLTEEGNVYSFGENDYGLLSIGESDTSYISNVPIKTYLNNIKHISAFSTTCLALTKDNKVYSFGNNNFFQLGVKEFTEKYSTEPIEISKFYNSNGEIENIVVSDILCGGITNFVLSSEGDLYTFGSGSNGQVGFDVNSVAYSTNENINLSNVLAPTKIVFYEPLSIYEINQDKDSPYRGKLPINLNNIVDVKIDKLLFSSGNRTFFKDINDNTWSIGDNTSGLLSIGDVSDAKVPVLSTLYRIENYDKDVVTKNYLIKPIIVLSVAFVLGIIFFVTQEVKKMKIKKIK